MQRHGCHPRADWRAKVEDIGLTYHSHDDGPYWDESACYELTAAEVNALESAANTLHRLCLEAAEVVIERGWWSRLRLPAGAIPAILRSWERDEFSLYGRFDLAFDGSSPPRLLEYNADTPTALLEASVAQWFWLQQLHPDADQFNSIHERLIEAWRRWAGTTIHFSSIKDHAEDEQTVLYLRDTCEQAGVKTQAVFVEDLGWDRRQECFVDLDLNVIRRCFKLYPWEWLWQEEFGAHLTGESVQFIEPAWKMLLSNKALLPILWELFPDHPNLLPAYELPTPLGGRYVRKPRLGREGSNITWVEGGVVVEETGGGYGEEGHVYQALASLPDFDGRRPIFGVWVVDHEAAGLGIREDTRRITGNLSRFVPHFFRFVPHFFR
ncbi:MAG: glutathionylspermidine synthase family protein [Verrucomicrobia bacterium]|nr:glutathionylspermidine synthase family protein [Verrucomicrobiota bacterium]